MNTILPIVSFQNAVKQSTIYWIIIGMIWLVGFVYLLMYGTYDSFLHLTKVHNISLDAFFSKFTHVGDGLFAIAIAVIFFLFKYRRASFNIVFSFLLSGLFAQIGKQLFAHPRPSRYFQDVGTPVHTLGVTNWGNNTFPSGHSATAFALVTVIILFFPKSKWNIIWILLAFLVGYSRIYVASHFLDDVLAGSMIGVLSAMICYILSNYLFYKKINFFHH